LKRTGFAGGHDRRALKQILQIVIAVAVQSANGNLFPRSLQLPIDATVIGAALCLDAKTAETPQLPLGAKTVRGLQNAKQYEQILLNLSGCEARKASDCWRGVFS